MRIKSSHMPMLLWAMSILMQSVRIAIAQDSNDLSSIDLQVTDMGGMPIAGAEASTLRWDGEWHELSISSKTDEQGKASLRSLPSDQYVAVVVKADGFAPTCSTSELSKLAKLVLNLKLAKPVSSEITVLNDKGQPVSSAMLSKLTVNDEGGGSISTRFGSKTPYGTTLPVSDIKGRIVLHDLPLGASVSATVLHPDWVQTEVQNLIAVEGKIGSVILKSGDKLQVNLIRDESLPELFKSESFYLDATPIKADMKTTPYLNHLFIACDDQFHATVERLDLDSISVGTKDEDIIVTPYLDQSDERFKEVLARPANGKRSIDFLVRKARSFQLRLVGDLSLINTDSYVWASTENKGPDSSSTASSLVDYVGCSIKQPSKDGRCSVMMPNGKARIEVFVPGAKVTPRRIELILEPGKEPIIPDFKIEKIEPIRGRAVDPQGMPVPNAVVRLYYDLWGTDYQRSNDQGEFQLESEQLYAAKSIPSESTVCRIMAFEPNGSRAGVIDIDPTRFDFDASIEITMENRSPSWVIDQIQQFLDCLQTDKNRKFRERLANEIENRKAVYFAGEVGSPPPSLSEGIWLQSDFNSLDEMRGKFVLLDFWYIGCGPCAVDMPKLKLARELFGGEDFEIVGVHSTPASAESVQQYIQQNGIKYPVVVDTHDGTLNRQYRELGVTSFPSYILLDRNGKILQNDHLSMKPNIRLFQIEFIYSTLRSARE